MSWRCETHRNIHSMHYVGNTGAPQPPTPTTPTPQPNDSLFFLTPSCLLPLYLTGSTASVSTETRRQWTKLDLIEHHQCVCVCVSLQWLREFKHFWDLILHLICRTLCLSHCLPLCISLSHCPSLYISVYPSVCFCITVCLSVYFCLTVCLCFVSFCVCLIKRKTAMCAWNGVFISESSYNNCMVVTPPRHTHAHTLLDNGLFQLQTDSHTDRQTDRQTSPSHLCLLCVSVLSVSQAQSLTHLIQEMNSMSC